MKGKIFLVGEQGKLEPMLETDYVNESELQKLLAKYWDLLPGDQIDPDEPRRWLFIGREIGIPGGTGEADWLSLDHLFLDQDAVPTFVECKRAKDTRARREVVAQMLDYAANGTVYWTAERLKQRANEDLETGQLDERVLTLLGPEAEMDVSAFWKKVDENLAVGRVRLIFVLDEAPRELRRLVEFLNEQMQETEVFLVEIKQFKGNANLHTLVPRLVGQTEKSLQKKRSGFTRKPLEEIYSDIGKHSPVELALAQDIEKFLREELGAEVFTTANGFAPRFDVGGVEYYPLKVREGRDGAKIVVWFQYLKKKSAFTDEIARTALLAKLNSIPGVGLPPDNIGGKPSFPISALTDPKAMEEFKSAVKWILAVATGMPAVT